MTCEYCKYNKKGYCYEYGKKVKPNSKKCWYFKCQLLEDLEEVEKDLTLFVELKM